MLVARELIASFCGGKNWCFGLKASNTNKFSVALVLGSELHNSRMERFLPLTQVDVCGLPEPRSRHSIAELYLKLVAETLTRIWGDRGIFRQAFEMLVTNGHSKSKRASLF